MGIAGKQEMECSCATDRGCIEINGARWATDL